MIEAVRRRTGFMILTGIVTLATALTGCGAVNSSQGHSKASLASLGQPLHQPLARSVLSAPLVDSTGHARTLAGFRGKTVVLSDTMTLCQETCPLDTAALVQSARKVESAGLGDRVEFVSLTVDPARDTPAQLRAYRKLFSPAPKNWTLLTGSPATVHRVLRSLGVYWKKVRGGDSPPPRSWRTNEPLRYDVDHSDELFFVGPESRERFLFDGPPHVSSSSAVPARLRGFMDAEGHHNLRKSAGREWTVPQVLTALSGITGHRIA